MRIEGKEYRTIWYEGKVVKIIDQTKLPHRFIIKELKTVKDAINAIKVMEVRGAPLIGGTAAYGIVLAIQERNDFLANASHELKTPLTNIMGISEIISNDPKAIIENKNFSKNLLVNVKRMQNLIYSLLDLSKVEINKNIIHYKLLSLEKISNSTIDEFKNIQSKEQNIEIFNNLKNKSLKLKTDEKEFKLLFFNILDNAFKYSSSLVKIYLEETLKNIEIIFQDNGIGIPKNEINRVTERFYRVKGNEKIEGSGLGLAIVSEIMNNHEGEIKIESEERVGTKVFLIFKRA